LRHRIDGKSSLVEQLTVEFAHTTVLVGRQIMEKNGSRKLPSPMKTLLMALGSLNLYALGLLARQGFSSAKAYVTYTRRLYAGYGLPWIWSNLPWREDMLISRITAHELFPDVAAKKP